LVFPDPLLGFARLGCAVLSFALLGSALLR